MSLVNECEDREKMATVCKELLKQIEELGDTLLKITGEIESLFFDCYEKQIRQDSVVKMRDFRKLVEETVRDATNRDNSSLNTNEVIFEMRQDIISRANDVLEKVKALLNE